MLKKWFLTAASLPGGQSVRIWISPSRLLNRLHLGSVLFSILLISSLAWFTPTGNIAPAWAVGNSPAESATPVSASNRLTNQPTGNTGSAPAPANPAQPTTNAAPTVTAPPSSFLVDPAQNGKTSIKLVKFQQDGRNGQFAATGADQQVSGKPLAGVQFTLKKVKAVGDQQIGDLNLTKNENWVKLAKVRTATGQLISQDLRFDPAFATKNLVTGVDGVVHFTNLPFGFYQITETKTPSGTTPISPVYLTLPFINRTDQGATSWNYHPIIKPKNSVDAATKQVFDSSTRGLGDLITYTISTTTGKYQGKAPTRYMVFDHLPKGLRFESVSLKFAKASTPLTSGSDYQIQVKQVDERDLVTITMQASGLKKIGQAFENDLTDKVVTQIKTKVTALIGATSSELVNQAGFIPNQDPYWQADGRKIPTPSVTTKLGQIVIKKVAQEDPKHALAGAVFTVFRSAEDAKQARNPLRFLNQAGQEVTETTTDQKGKAVIAGLRQSNFADGHKLDKPQSYWLVEKVAPSGRKLLASPVEVVLDTSERTVEVKNPLQNLGFSLPKTGANGGAILTSSGLILLGAAVLMLRRFHRFAQ